MTICGVLKDIILVFASIAIWGTPVTGLQFFGYSISLAAMVYFKLGGDNIKGYFSEGARRWADYGVKHPAQRKMVVFFGVILTIFLILGGLAPTVGYDTQTVATEGKSWVGSLLGKGTGLVTDSGKVPSSS